MADASGKLPAMTKPGDEGNSTQPLSESQVVAVGPKPPPHGIPPGNQSVAWKGTVVGADEFSLSSANKTSRAKWAVAGVLGAGVVGGGVYLLWPSSSSPTAASTAGSGSAAAPAPPPDAAPPPIDAAPPPVDAAAAPPDAAAEPASTPAKPPAKKPPVKKKQPVKNKAH